MPRYEYKCKKCNKSFEETHGINDSVESCKYCGGEVRRVFHPVGIVFKGSGFYATDARNSSNESRMPQAKETKPEEKKTEEAPQSKKDDKTEKDSGEKPDKPKKKAS
ncbi:MAG: hypothetical protein JW738_09955 [Actinobacteria bacterium]|nr:hypothetical protein [Actinomycetota bacterium]